MLFPPNKNPYVLLEENNRFNMRVIDRLIDSGRYNKKQKRSHDESSSKRVNSLDLEPITQE
jgi:hypothetical protein